MKSTKSNVQTAKKYILEAVKHWKRESLYRKATLNYQKTENFMNQNTFINAAKETLNNINLPDWWQLIILTERKKNPTSFNFIFQNETRKCENLILKDTIKYNSK